MNTAEMTMPVMLNLNSEVFSEVKKHAASSGESLERFIEKNIALWARYSLPSSGEKPQPKKRTPAKPKAAPAKLSAEAWNKVRLEKAYRVLEKNMPPITREDMENISPRIANLHAGFTLPADYDYWSAYVDDEERKYQEDVAKFLASKK